MSTFWEIVGIYYIGYIIALVIGIRSISKNHINTINPWLVAMASWILVIMAIVINGGRWSYRIIKNYCCK